MKTFTLWLISLMCAILPMAATAQTNIRKAFDSIIECPQAKITESHTLDKDPATNLKIGQSDIYRFILPADKAKLVKNVIAAFKQDSEMSFSYNHGTLSPSENDIELAVGDAAQKSVSLKNNYIYALYLAPLSEDPEGIYRYAYGMDYEEKDGMLEGKLIVTYATTLKYRQQKEQDRQNAVLGRFSNGVYVRPGVQQSTFDRLLSYIQSMSTANTQTRIALATKTYKLIAESSSDMTSAEKDTIREILNGMISDKKYSDTVLNTLLNQSVIGIR